MPHLIDSSARWWRSSRILASSLLVLASLAAPSAADALSCNGAAETFETGLPPGWTVIDASPGGTGIDWVTTASAACEIENSTNGSGEAACADSDAAGSGAPPYDTRLTTNAFSLAGMAAASLEVSAFYNDLGAGNDLLAIDLWNGAAWVPLLVWDEDHVPEDVALDLTPWAGDTNLQVRFRYSGNGFDWYAQVDDVRLSCAPAARAAVVGAGVADENEDGTGDNHSDPPPGLQAAAINASGGLDGTIRYHAEWSLASLAPGTPSRALVRLTTEQGTVDSLDTFFFTGTGSGNGVLEDADFQVAATQVPGVVMPVAGEFGDVETFHFAVGPALDAALLAGHSHFVVQARVNETASPNFMRGLQIHTTANPTAERPQLLFPFFADGFEWGGTARWSSTQP